MFLLDSAVALLHHLLVLTASHLTGPEEIRLGVAIALVTVAVRLALLPLSIRSVRSARGREALLPQVEALRQKHRHDRTTLAKEIHELHRRAGISPLAGMGPMLLTIPVMMALYRMVSLLGSPLGTHWLPLLTTGGPAAVGVLVALLAGLVLVAWLSSRQQPAGSAVFRMLPFGTVGFAVLVPLAVSIYLLTTTAWTVAERAVLPRLV